MEFDSPKPTKNWGFGWTHLTKALPKFAIRLGVAMSAMSVCGIGYSVLVDSNAEWAKAMGIIGVLGAGISAFFGKK